MCACGCVSGSVSQPAALQVPVLVNTVEDAISLSVLSMLVFTLDMQYLMALFSVDEYSFLNMQ